jgi:peptidoglycan/LPS O-acetylase OafA/YrhL
MKRPRPGRLWLFFWGRKRRGFPGLMAALFVALLVLALLYGQPAGVNLSRWLYFLFPAALLALILGSLVAVGIGLLRPPRRRR